MLISISGKVPECEEFLVSLADEKKQLSSAEPLVSFQVDRPGKYTVSVEHHRPTYQFNLLHAVLFFLTAPIQGIFHAFLSNTASEWHKEVRAYTLKALLSVDVKSGEDVKIDFSYKNSYYAEVFRQWRYPRFSVQQDIETDITFVRNPGDFAYRYTCYCERVISVFSILDALFLLMLWSGIKNFSIPVIAISSIILLGSLLRMFFLLYFQYKKMKKLRTRFEQQSDEEACWE